MATLLQSTTIGGHAAIHAGNIASQSVNYASSTGSVAWTNVSGRPTALSQFSNDLGNYGGFLVASSLTGYATQSWVTTQGYLSGSYIPAGGAWLGDFGSNGFTRQTGISYTGGEWSVLTKNAQISTLIDGSYFAGESGGFYSLTSANTFASRKGFYNDGTYANFNTSILVNGDIVSTSAIYPGFNNGASGSQTSYYFYGNTSNSGIRTNGNLLVNSDIYLGTRGQWLSTYLNQNVRTDSSPTFASVYFGGSQLTTSMVNGLSTMLGVTSLPYSVDIIVDGDPDTYYPVHFIWGDQDVWRRIIIKRGYGEQAPWDPIGSGVHHGGLLLDWEGNFGGWGGAAYSDRLRVFQESYTTICADMYRTTHSMGYTFFLRGGGAIYHIYSDQSIRGYQNSSAPDIAYDTNYKFYDGGSNPQYTVYAPAPLTSQNSTRIDGLRTKKQSEFDGRYSQLGHTHDDRYYTESEVNTLLAGKQAAGSYAAASHTHDDRYYTESEVNTLLAGKQAAGSYAAASHNHDGVYVPVARTITINGTSYDLSANRSWTVSGSDATKLPLAGGEMSGRLTLKSISGVEQTVPNDFGAYLHLGNWGVGRTDPSVVLVNTAYRADYADSLFDMNISRFTNNSGYITGYTETDTLATVTSRGASTSTTLTTTVDTSSAAFVARNNGTANRWYGRIGSFNSTSDKSTFIGTYATVAVVGAHNNALTAWASLYINNVDGSNGGNVYLPSNSYVAGNGIIHGGNIGSQSVNYASSAGSATSATTATYATSATRLYASDSPYRYGDGSPYYLYMNYDGGSYWELKVTPATPGTVRVAYANTSGSVAWSNVSSRPTALSQFTNDLGNYGGWLTTSGKAADSELIDGIDSSRIIFGDGSFGSTNYSDMNNTAQKSGFFFYNQPTGNPFGDWTHWINSMGNSWNPNYGFQLAHAFHSDRFAVRVVANGGFASWRTIIDSGNIGSQSVNYAASAGNSATTSQRSYNYLYASDYLESSGAVYGTIFYDNNDRAFYCDPNSTSRLNAVVYNDLKWTGDQSYGFLGRNVYADTINGRGSDPLEINYYDGGSVIIGSGVNGSKGLYAGSLYDAGSRVAISRGEGRNYVDYSRYVYNNGAYSGSGWIEPSDLGVRYADSANYASSAGSAGSASYARYFPTYYVGGVQTNPQVYFNNGIGLNVAMTGAWSVWSDTLWVNGYSGGDVPWMCALHFLRNSEPRMAISAQKFDSSGYGGYYEVVTSYNIASQSVSYANSAGSLSGFDKTNPSFGAVYANNWFRAYGDTGLYQQDYGGHFRRNVSSSHGTWEIFGYAKGGYNGLLIKDDAGYINNYMHEGGNGGLYLENQGGRWPWYWHRGNACLGLGNSSTSSSYRVYVNGSLYAEGDIVAYSDSRKKSEIVTIDGALEKVKQLRGVYYVRTDETEKGRQTGVIAQEINEVLPEVVTYAEDVDEYGVKYGNIVGVLIEAIKEQQREIDELKAKLN